MVNDTIGVVEVIPGGPSEKVGLMPGDKIVLIDDSVATGPKISNSEVMKRLRGDKGTQVKLGIRRQNTDKLLTFTVTRGDIPVNTVDSYYMLDKNTGYIKVNQFGRHTYDEFITAMASLQVEGAKRYMIDLRGNGTRRGKPQHFTLRTKRVALCKRERGAYSREAPGACPHYNALDTGEVKPFGPIAIPPFSRRPFYIQSLHPKTLLSFLCASASLRELKPKSASAHSAPLRLCVKIIR